MSNQRKWFLAGTLQVMIAYLESMGIPDHYIETLKEIQTFLAEE